MKVLLRCPFEKHRVPYKKFILKGKVLRRSKGYDKYLVVYRDTENNNKKQWMSVENIASRTLEEEKERRLQSRQIFERMEQKRRHKAKYYIVQEETEHVQQKNNAEREQKEKKRRHRLKYYLVLDEPREESNTEVCTKYFCGDQRVKIVKDPQGSGSCQFQAVAHQLRKIGILRTDQQLRLIAVKHIPDNRHHYADFIYSQDFDTYLKNMCLERTYGDNLTLQALAREFNCQFLVLNARGHEYHRMVSNTNVFDSDLPLFTLGYFPENEGEHYVSVEVQHEYLQELVQTHIHFDIGTSIESVSDKQSKSDSLKQQHLESDSNTDLSFPFDASFEENFTHTDKPSMTFNASHSGSPELPCNHTFSPSGMNILPAEAVIADNTTEAEYTAIPLRNRQGPQPDSICEEMLPYLPDLVLEKIIVWTIRMHPMMRYILQKVSVFFAATVRSLGYPAIYINPSLMDDVPRIISVRRLCRVFGSHSGLMLRLRRILRDSGSIWINAWLSLNEVDNSWFEIRDVQWRHI